MHLRTVKRMLLYFDLLPCLLLEYTPNLAAAQQVNIWNGTLIERAGGELPPYPKSGEIRKALKPGYPPRDRALILDRFSKSRDRP